MAFPEVRNLRKQEIHFYKKRERGTKSRRQGFEMSAHYPGIPPKRDRGQDGRMNKESPVGD